MGLSYTVDSPVKVARFGISSVVSIIEDRLIEKMRKYYYEQRNEPYLPITEKEPDFKARRITDYLNLLDRIVKEQMERLRNSTFEAGSELVLYFEMLPHESKLKQLYLQMLDTREGQTRDKLQHMLRQEIRPGSIDVNIMTKVDPDPETPIERQTENNSHALAALRGFANSELTEASVVLSAGMNPRLYSYMESLRHFSEYRNGRFRKMVTVKVSDYRSALIQGKFLAKKGIWVSEFRVESGLNCGGHTFASDGILLGTILEEFKEKRAALVEELFGMWKDARIRKGMDVPDTAPQVRLTVQGGIGTHEEDVLLRDYYQADGTGWGTPFLLVPEAVVIDPESLARLSAATEADVVSSGRSPLGVRFSSLKDMSAEKEKWAAAAQGKPGSICTERKLALNTEYPGTPLCTASKTYQRRKLAELDALSLPEAEYQERRHRILEKECLCVGLSNSAVINYRLSPFGNSTRGITICPGPNIAYFSKISTLREMVDHIYGRINLLNPGYRPHFFVKEIGLYLDYLKEECFAVLHTLDDKRKKYFIGFCNNLLQGIAYYRGLIGKVIRGTEEAMERIREELLKYESEIQGMLLRLA